MSLTQVAEVAHEVADLGMPTWMFGGIALVAFAAAGIVTWTYRDVANRHQDKAEAYKREHEGTH
ncbi:hypothetical protein [Lysinibacter sp. HNR]|uniref:hypothetical protein n=1 Tax=Lysinibacter sp. HNR TaxID=3031408 RepID=UPI002434B532|nr:hypothetical protein [Lysinibacter sp. HNR]WGD36266.1 hypothetical protein FrondiHNR_07165 [Lysinibacter sp. HNR]